MNIIKMTGGLGNQMFQYALYLKLQSMGRTVKIDDITEYKKVNPRPNMLWCFDIDYQAATQEEINRLTDGFMKFSHRVRRKIFGRKSLEYHEKNNNFDKQVLEREPAYLTGYFQSENYFKDMEEQVRKAFTFSDRIWDDISTELAWKMREYQRQIDSTLSVSIHVRRGDYISSSEVYGDICTEKYYQKAIDLMKEKFTDAVFYVFSNESGWCRQWLKQHYLEEERFIVIEGTTEDIGYLDLFLMSRCRAHIIANSSFSWWGAWLNPDKEKIIIAPARWLNNQNVKDIYTAEMLKVSSNGEIEM